jgi:hypothetical protein
LLDETVPEKRPSFARSPAFWKFKAVLFWTLTERLWTRLSGGNAWAICLNKFDGRVERHRGRRSWNSR